MDNRSSLLIILLDEIDFQNNKGLDDQKLSKLREEIISSFKKSNCVALICNAFESSIRHELFKIGSKALENFASNICAYLKLSAIECIALGYCLCQSQFRIYLADSHRIIKSKCLEINSLESIASVSDDLLAAIGQYVYSSEDLSNLPASENLLNLIKARLGSALNQRNNSLSLNENNMKPSIAKILGEIGAVCTTNADIFRGTLHNIGQKLDEEQLAAIIVTTLARAIHDNEEKKKLNDPSFIAWNLEIIADVLFQESRGLNWTLVAKSLDHPSLVIRSESDYQLLTRFFVRIAGCSLPAAGLLSHSWTNKTAQFAMLTLSASASRNIVDFSPLITAEQLISGEGIAAPPNLSWLCPHLYSRFFAIATSGMTGEVMDVLTKSAAVYPEYFLISLSQVQDTTNSGIRSELLRRLLPLFTGLQGSKPTYISVMRKLHTANPDILILLCRIAFKKAKKLWEVVNIDTLLTSLGTSIIRRLEEEGTPDELMSYYCVKADRGDINLEEKLVILLESNPKNARVFVNFAKSHIEALHPRNNSSQQNESILSFECFAALLRAAQGFPAIVPIEELRSLATIYSQQQNLQVQQQQQQQMLQMQNQQQSIGNTVRESSIAESNFPPDAVELVRLPPGPETDEIEALANSYFQKIYTTDLNILDIISLLRQFKGSNEKKDQEIFRCMIYNLFDEYRFFHKYPEKELLITGRLFGALIQHQLVSSITLGIGLRYVLEALRKDPELGESNDKMFRFGRIALDQFRSRLSEWPQYCSHLIQIPHLARHNPDLFQEAQRALSSPQQSAQPTPPVQMNMHIPVPLQMPSQQQQINQLHNSFGDNGSISSSIGLPSQSFGGLQSSVPTNSGHSVENNLGGVNGLAQQFGGLGVSTANVGFNPSISSQSVIPAVSGSLNVPAPIINPPPVEATSQLGRSPSATQVSPPSFVPSTVNPSGVISPEMNALPTPITAAPEAMNETSHRTKISEIVRMAQVNGDVLNTTMPTEAVRDQIHFIINNIAKNNFDVKTNEIRSILKPEHFNWFANYLVVKRISTQPNLHPLYLSVLDTLDFNALVKAVLDSAYHNVTRLLQSPNITTSSSERSLLRNLGVWLGQMTLAKNRPLLQRRINLKELLFWGFETGRLIAVCSFVAKIVEGVKDSKVFRPPNPWLMSLLGIMRELYEIEDLKLNIKFEVQVLCKNINIKIEDIPKGNELALCKVPIKDQRNPDFNFKQSSIANASPITNQSPPSMSPMTAPVIPQARQSTVIESLSALPAMAQIQLPQAAAPLAVVNTSTPVVPIPAVNFNLEQQLQAAIANLSSSIVINPSIQYFASNPNQRRLVVLAVERAIKEILQSAVERSVSIAGATTKSLLLKDFATEPNEQNLRDGAHLMISCLAGSLALATCKEPLRIAIGNHLRTLLAQSISDQAVIEQIVQISSNENVEIGVLLIEKAAVEKSVREMDELLLNAMQVRRSARDAGQSFVDTVALSSGGAKYINEIPDALKPRMGGLVSLQLRLYETFQRTRLTPTSSDSANPSPSLTGQLGNGIADIKSLPPASGANQIPTLSMSQALETYQLVLTRIDVALRTLHTQLQGREVTISMLGSDNEILLLLRDLITVTQRTQPNVRNETAMTFSENIFNRMFDSINNPDSLRLEVFVAILEAIRDACGGVKFFAPDFISWLGKYAVLVSNDETARKVYRLILILLLRAKLIRCPDIDTFFVMYIDGGRNLFWLELALSFIRQCLVEGMGTIFEFGGIFEAVTKMRPTNMVLKKQLQKWLTDIKELANNQEEQSLKAAQGSNVSSIPSTVATNPRDVAVREHITVLLDRWLKVWSTVNEQIFNNYLSLMEQYGILKTEEATDRFFRVSCEICIEACLRSQSNATAVVADGSVVGTLNFTVIDALSKLFLLLVRLADKEPSNLNVRVNLLNRILTAITKVLLDDHEAKRINSKIAFDQRPYYRLLANMSHDLGVPDMKQEPNSALFPLLAAYTQVFLALQPSTVPGFAYSWLQLVSRRSFMPQLLLAKGQKGWALMHRLLASLLLFLQPFLKIGQMTDALRKLYKGTLRVLLILLHDFPEFLSDYHLSFCDLIPINCVQLRNMILSAFPRTMRLPDPFTPNLKIDVLSESSQAPRILSDYLAPLSSIRTHLDNYMTHKQPVELPSKLPAILLSPNGYNVPLITSLVVYVGSMAIVQVQSNKVTLSTSPAMDIYKQMTVALDAEGRYIVFNTMANQLRYPNSHTSFFSYVLLNLFLDADNDYIQEQITRVLLERLIVHRPHPWGLLITFIELIKNPKYSFWRKSFTHSVPDMEKVFESIARSCIGPTASNVIQQQLNNGL